MYEGFRAGVDPGGLTTDYEIKILICYLLYHLGTPLPVSALIDIFVGEGLGNYFEVASAASSLVKSGHIVITADAKGEHNYEVTEVGSTASDTFEKNLPLSVRDKALTAAERYFVMERHKLHNKTEVKKVEDGFLLTLTITDVGSDLLKMTILLPDEESCDRIRDRFMEDPVVVYKGVVAMLTGSFENVGALLDSPSQTNAFLGKPHEMG